MTRHITIGLSLLALAAGTPPVQTTWHVDDDCPNPPGTGTPEDPFCSIQAGVASAGAGDEVVVAPGEYLENINLLGKAITVRSTDGPDVTMLDGGGAGSVITCSTGEGPDTVLQGFTITGGHAVSGGGMYVYQADPVVIGCTFLANSAGAPLSTSDARGGGMHLYESDATVINCAFFGNSAAVDVALAAGTAWGGGISVTGGSPTVVNCTFSGNSVSATAWLFTAYAYGGGIGNDGGALTVSNCTFSGNSASTAPFSQSAFGAGVCSPSGGTVSVANSVFFNNTTGMSNPDVYGTVTVSYSCAYPSYVFGTGNISYDPLLVGGGDMHLQPGSPCIDAGNNAAVPADTHDLDGDGVTAEPIPLDLDWHPRFMDDPNTWDTGAGDPPIVDMGCDEFGGPDCNENGLPDDWDIDQGASEDCNANGVPDECEPGGLEDCNENDASDLCDLYVGTSQDCNTNESGIPDECEPGGLEDCNTNEVPDLCDIYDGTSEDCNDNAVPDECEPDEDCNGNEVQDICDIAEETSDDCNGNGVPDECEGPVLYVDDDAPAGGDGLDWGTALYNLQEALALADCTVTEIRVAQGTYVPDTSGLWDPREATFQLISGVAIYGGYAGCGAVDPDEREITVYETTLSGDLNGDDDDVIDPGPGGGTPGQTCAEAGPINDGETAFDTRGATTDGHYGCPVDKDIWYVYTASRSGYVVVSLCGSSYNTRLGVYGGNTCPPATLLACNFDYCGRQSQIEVAVTEGNEYLIQVGGYPGNSGSGVINISYYPRRDNSYHVATGSGTDATAVLDGFTITAGNADHEFSGPPTVGGGMYNDWGSPTLANCTFTGNSATEHGGGMYNRYNSSPTVANCTFTGNSATEHGGGMYNYGGSSPTLTNCTFTGNSADYGGGMYNDGQSSPTLTNCILWGDAPNEIHNSSSTCTMTYSCIRDDDPDDGSVYPGVGNIDDDPLFARNPDNGGDGWGDDPDTPDINEGANDAYGDLHLQPRSPCIDVGDNDAPGLDGVSSDLDGNPRMMDDPDTPDGGNPGAPGPPIVDMGVYEYWPDCNDNDVADVVDMLEGTSADCNTSGVPDECEPGGLEDCNANGTTDWCDMLAGTSDDCNDNDIPDECDIAGGTSDDRDEDDIPDECEPVHNITLDTIHPTIQEAIDLAEDGHEIEVGPGIFVERINLLGKVITLRSTEGPDVTIIDGDADGSVITCTSGEGPNTVIEGFTVANGRADNGGGMYNSGSSPTVINCIFSGNSPTGAHPDGVGGGMYNHQASPTLIDCTFSGNSATGTHGRSLGGGMYNHEASPTLTDCTFSGNSAGSGGGMCNEQSSPALTDCAFSGNSGSYGGGMDNEQSSPTLTDCTFSGNSATVWGGGMFNGQSSPTLTDCTFSGNSATGWGGGMLNANNSCPALTSCTFSENSAGAGGGMLNNNSSSPAVTSCMFSGNSADSGGGLCNVQESAPTVTNCTFSGNSAYYDGGGMYNFESSPTLANSTFSGNSADAGGGGMYNYTQHSGSHPTVANCVLWGNTAPTGQQIFDTPGSITTATYSCVQDDDPDDGVVYPGEGNIDADPLFVPGPVGCYYLSQTTAGDPKQSPCIDVGNDTAENLGLDTMTTRSDEATDSGVVDMGYHYPVTGLLLIMGDYDRNGDVTLFDFAAMQICFTNEGPTDVSPCCRIFDFEPDSDVDLDDFDVVQATFTGPQ
ncbi:MAG: hypothetical protein ACYTFA_06610 [Planctomycetota bacterium]|jgi:parallel beta-helix repeat protein